MPLFIHINKRRGNKDWANLQETCNRKILSIIFEPQTTVSISVKRNSKHTKEAIKKSLPYDSDVLTIQKCTSAAAIELNCQLYQNLITKSLLVFATQQTKGSDTKQFFS